MATIVHFNISAADTERAKAFYEKLFDWKIEKLPMDYYMIGTDDLQGKPGIGGGMTKRGAGDEAGIVNYIGVASIDTTLGQITELGGKILQPKQEVPGYGLLALCADTENNVFGVFEERQP